MKENVIVNNNGSNKKKLIILYIILGLSVGAMAFFAIVLALEIHNTRQGEEFYDSVSIDIIPRPVRTSAIEEPTAGHDDPGVPPIEDETNDPGVTTDIITTTEPETATEPIIETTERPASAATATPAQRPGRPSGAHIPVPTERVAAPAPQKPLSIVDFGAMRRDFPDIVAWVQSPGTVINYPVVQTTDNEFYLTRLPDKSKNSMGSVFLDYRNSNDFSDQHILLYGHDMKSGNIFGTLRHYADQAYYEKHYSIFFFTPGGDYEVMLLAGYVLDSAVTSPPLGFSNERHFNQYIDDIRERSFFKSNVQVSYGDRLVFFCTCARGGPKSERLVIVGKLVGI